MRIASFPEKRMVNFWRFIMPEIKEKEKLPTPQKQAAYSIVGKSQTVYLEEVPKDNIDNNGVPLLENTNKQRRETEEFDWDKYV
jgi:hypothetical protein